MRDNIIIIMTLLLLAAMRPGSALASRRELPGDLGSVLGGRYSDMPGFPGSAGGDTLRDPAERHGRYPVIMIPSRGRSIEDFTGKNTGNGRGMTDVYMKFISAGFVPQELWMYSHTPGGEEMAGIEELTDRLKRFIYAVLCYTRSSRVQILACGEGAVLAKAAMAKYNLYGMIHAAVFINGPMHGSRRYSCARALEGFPSDAGLEAGSDLIKDITLPEETPYGSMKGGPYETTGTKYMTIRNGFFENADLGGISVPSAALLGARNIALYWLDNDGLRTDDTASRYYIQFLSDAAVPYSARYDRDRDGFMGTDQGGPDLDDNDPSIYPGAAEVPEDGIDQDCNRMDLIRGRGKDVEVPSHKVR